MKMRILAMGQDLYWFAAMKKAIAILEDDLLSPRKQFRSVKCAADLPRANANTLLLIDASEQLNLEATIVQLRQQGWRYVVVVSADPTAKQATAVLHWDQGYDYWEKTYDEQRIGKQVQAFFDEIRKAQKLTKT
jgi:hypothetical protein